MVFPTQCQLLTIHVTNKMGEETGEKTGENSRALHFGTCEQGSVTITRTNRNAFATDDVSNHIIIGNSRSGGSFQVNNTQL
jgi:hypothetical protein